MSTLLAAIYPDGRLERCTATCYNATTETCRCVCGGINHGVGYWQAIANLRTLAEAIVLDVLDRHKNGPQPQVLLSAAALATTNPLLFDQAELAACHPKPPARSPGLVSTPRATSEILPFTARAAAGSSSSSKRHRRNPGAPGNSTNAPDGA